MGQRCRGGAPIIFTHYGASDYLGYSLRQASRTNPEKPRILIGDKFNRDSAIANGWQHIDYAELGSTKKDRFNARFRWVQGKKHHPIRAGRDWLRYVFERFFYIEELIRREQIHAFWHFDSDTMILLSLKQFEERLEKENVRCTTLCNDKCLGGWCTSEALSIYCDYIIPTFEDEGFLQAQQSEFDNLHPEFAYTEMRAFIECTKHRDLPTLHLAPLFAEEGLWFDDCVCQRHGFDTIYVSKIGGIIKDLVKNGDYITAKRSGIDMVFATLNCSWVATDVFEWVEKATLSPCQVDKRLANHLKLSFPSSLRLRSKRLLKKLCSRVRNDHEL